MGFACVLDHVGNFTYRAELDQDLVEHEIDHVFIGRFNASPVPTESEVAEWRWVERDTLNDEMQEEPERFTAWLAPAVACLGSAKPRVE